MTGRIEIVCGTDAHYAPHLAVMLKSLAAYNKKHRVRVHVLHDNVPDEICKRVEACNQEIEINWINAINHQVLSFKGRDHISSAAYLRLMIPEVLDKAITRVLYLDIDIIINGDIVSLWNTQLGDKVCAAVADAWVDAKKFAERWHLSGNGRYFNSGVMLFDLDKLRSKPYMEEAIKMIASPNHSLKFIDQDALNIVLWDEWLEVDFGWNLQRMFLANNYTLRPAQNYQPAIIHFTEIYKPWRKDDWHPCRWLYLRMLLKTPFKTQVLKAGGINAYYLCKAWLKWRLKRPPMFRLPRR